MVERKLFLLIPSVNIMYPNEENMISMPITKTMEIVTGIQISWMKFHYEENGEKKAFPANPKHQFRVSQCGENDCHVNNKKNGDYYEYPGLSHFSNEL